MIILGLENKSSTAQLKVHYLVKYASLLFSKGTGNTDTLRRKEKLKFKLRNTCLPESIFSLKHLRLQILP